MTESDRLHWTLPSVRKAGRRTLVLEFAFNSIKRRPLLSIAQAEWCLIFDLRSLVKLSTTTDDLALVSDGAAALLLHHKRNQSIVKQWHKFFAEKNLQLSDGTLPRPGE